MYIWREPELLLHRSIIIFYFILQSFPPESFMFFHIPASLLNCSLHTVDFLPHPCHSNLCYCICFSNTLTCSHGRNQFCLLGTCAVAKDIACLLGEEGERTDHNNIVLS